jgi:ElaB/YqjD/DUF883 family membrane-anchored ribosome-binding protein
MKNLILSIFMIFSMIGFSQEYPMYIKDESGKDVVILTVEQVQHLDNQTDLIPLYEKLVGQGNVSEDICLKVVNEKEQVIAKQDLIIKNLENLTNNKDEQIKNLKEQIDNYIAKEILFNKEIENKDKEINLHIDRINTLRGKVWISGGIGVVTGLVLGIFLGK